MQHREGDYNSTFAEYLNVNDEPSGVGPAADASIDILYSQARRRLPRITPQEEQELAARAQAGDLEARDRLVEDNVGLAYTIVRQNRMGVRGVIDFSDSLQGAYEALIVAANKYRPGYVSEKTGKPVRFSMYAGNAIRWSVRHEIAQNSYPLTLSQKAGDIIYKMRGAGGVFIATQGSEPSSQALSTLTGVEEDEVTRLQYYSLPALSLQGPFERDEAKSVNLGTEDDRPESLEEVIPSEAMAPEQEAEGGDLGSRLRLALGRLTTRESQVISLYYGIDDVEMPNLAAVAGMIGISRERVRQLHDKALQKLRHPQVVQGIQGYY